ncbi:cytosolic factor, phosphatidylinositol/phosphatidylcholine transfer protein, partial [Cladochytrium tenue]
ELAIMTATPQPTLYNAMENLQGRLGHLTPEEEATLRDFKVILTEARLYDPATHSDHLLLRFLRARKFQIPLAFKMWQECQTWREEFGTNTIITDFDFPEYPIVKKFYPRFYHKTDKIGRPVYIDQIGLLDVKQLFAVTTDEKMLREHIYEYEKLVEYRLPACSLKEERNLEQSCVIMDLKGVSLSQFTSVYGLIRQVSAYAQNYYPEMLGKMPLLDEVTVNKINILGTNYTEKLLESIDPQNLPAFLGGQCECEGGCETSDIGPWNDGSVPGYPKPEFHRLETLYSLGDLKYDRHVKKANGSQ